MRKIIIAVAAVLICSTVAFTQEHKERDRPPQPPPSSPDQNSQNYTSVAGRYTIAFPGGKQPDLSTQNITDPNGQPVPQYLATVIDGTDAYMVAYFEYGPGIVFNLDKARDGMVNSLNGTLLEEHAMTIGGSSGREIRIAARTEQGLDFIDQARFYNVGPRVYVLQCVFPKSKDGAAMAERCERFLDSFRVRIPS